MHWSAPLAALESKNFLGGGPPDPLQETIPLTFPLTMCVHPLPNLALCTFQTFWAKRILTPDNTCNIVRIKTSRAEIKALKMVCLRIPQIYHIHIIIKVVMNVFTIVLTYFSRKEPRERHGGNT